ncbi:MAG: hypothetical protein CMB80_15960 [Flammeovirgaceae bacterium]|nr:hypothetical protein [Flammeovirgaceae bacterium]
MNLGQTQELKGVKFFKLISSQNKLKHTLKFSLIALLFLQIMIIPFNFGLYKPGDIEIFSILVVMLLIWYFNCWSYRRLFTTTNSLSEIFGLTGGYFSFVWLTCYIELALIDLIDKEFNILAFIVFIIMGQLAALIISLFTSIFYYLIIKWQNQ